MGEHRRKFKRHITKLKEFISPDALKVGGIKHIYKTTTYGSSFSNFEKFKAAYRSEKTTHTTRMVMLYSTFVKSSRSIQQVFQDFGIKNPSVQVRTNRFGDSHFEIVHGELGKQERLTLTPQLFHALQNAAIPQEEQTVITRVLQERAALIESRMSIINAALEYIKHLINLQWTLVMFVKLARRREDVIYMVEDEEIEGDYDEAWELRLHGLDEYLEHYIKEEAAFEDLIYILEMVTTHTQAVSSLNILLSFLESVRDRYFNEEGEADDALLTIIRYIANANTHNEKLQRQTKERIRNIEFYVPKPLNRFEIDALNDSRSKRHKKNEFDKFGKEDYTKMSPAEIKQIFDTANLNVSEHMKNMEDVDG